MIPLRTVYLDLIRLGGLVKQVFNISYLVSIRGHLHFEGFYFFSSFCFVAEIKKRLSEAGNEEQYQSVGHLSREAIISLAQEVYGKEKHPSLDGTDPSDTDAKRMLEAYFAVTLAGSSNESVRRFSRSTLTLANELTHKRTATKKEALFCSLATFTLINIVKTIEEG